MVSLLPPGPPITVSTQQPEWFRSCYSYALPSGSHPSEAPRWLHRPYIIYQSITWDPYSSIPTQTPYSSIPGMFSPISLTSLVLVQMSPPQRGFSDHNEIEFSPTPTLPTSLPFPALHFSCEHTAIFAMTKFYQFTSYTTIKLYVSSRRKDVCSITFGFLTCFIHFCIPSAKHCLTHNRCLVNITEWIRDLILPSLSLLPSPTCSFSSGHSDRDTSVPPAGQAHTPFRTFPSVWNAVVPTTPPPQPLSFHT